MNFFCSRIFFILLCRRILSQLCKIPTGLRKSHLKPFLNHRNNVIMKTTRWNGFRCAAFVLLLLTLFYITYKLLAKEAAFVPDSRVERSFYEWKKCYLEQINRIQFDPKVFYDELPRAVSFCERKSSVSNLITQIAGDGENREVLTQQYEQHLPSQVVVIGVGNDASHISLYKQILHPNSRIIGVDASPEISEKAFKGIGTLFPFRIVDDDRIHTTPGIELFERNRLPNVGEADRVGLGFFMKTIAASNKIVDALWISVWGEEYEFLPFFHRLSDFDQLNLQICSINIEFSSPDDYQERLLRNFLVRIVHNNQYGIYRVRTDRIRKTHVVLVNFYQPGCVSRYLKPLFTDEV